MITTLTEMVPPAIDPVTLEEIYDVLKLDALGSPPTHPHDDLLRQLITASTRKVERMTNRALIARTVKQVMSRFPQSQILYYGRSTVLGSVTEEVVGPAISLWKPPIIAVDSVTYYDTSNVLQTLSAASYFTTSDTLLATIQPVDGYFWPDTYPRADAVNVTYRSGYLDDTGSPTPSTEELRAAVPAELRQAIKICVQLAYDDMSVEKLNALEIRLRTLTEGYRVRTF